MAIAVLFRRQHLARAWWRPADLRGGGLPIYIALIDGLYVGLSMRSSTSVDWLADAVGEELPYASI